VNQQIVAGDRVVDLAASLRAAATLAGAISGSVSLWMLRRSIAWSTVSLVGGGVLGFLLGWGLAKVLYPAVPGQTSVVKLGQGAMSAALKSDLIGAVVTGVIVAVIPAVASGRADRLFEFARAGGGIGIIVGVTLGYLAAHA
jgi:hypothetical protein